MREVRPVGSTPARIGCCRRDIPACAAPLFLLFRLSANAARRAGARDDTDCGLHLTEFVHNVEQSLGPDRLRLALAGGGLEMRKELLTSMGLAGLMGVSVVQGADAAPMAPAVLPMAAPSGGSLERVYYYHGRYYPYRYNNRYAHRVYRHGRWHYYWSTSRPLVRQRDLLGADVIFLEHVRAFPWRERLRDVGHGKQLVVMAVPARSYTR